MSHPCIYIMVIEGTLPFIKYRTLTGNLVVKHSAIKQFQ